MNSLRPLPTSPAIPSISPARTSRSTPRTSCPRRMPRALSTTGAPGPGSWRSGYCSSSCLPIMSVMSELRLLAAAAAVRISTPSRSTEILSETPSTSSRACEISTTATPDSASLRASDITISTWSGVIMVVGSSRISSRTPPASALRISTNSCWTGLRFSTSSSAGRSRPLSLRSFSNARRADRRDTRPGPQVGS